MKSNQSQWNNAMESLEDIIFNLSEDNIIKSVEKALNLKTQNFSPCSPLTICRLIYSSSLSQMKDFNIYLNFMKNLEAKENETSENQYELIKTFGNFLKDINSQESYFLLNKMIENNLISSKLIENKNSFYFAQYYPIDLIYKLKDNQNTPYQKYFDENYHKLSIRNWKLHKKFIEEGHNPDELARIIRNDEIEKLQEISSHPKFDFNQAIPNSLYERCDYINRRFDDVSLIDYAAFFGSIKCFKYLLMNNADVKRTGTYAVAGGNLEIVHLCEQNHSLFGNDAYETAIKFHRNDIFFYLYENSKIESFLFRDFLHLFLYSLDEYYNIKIFNFFLEQERIEINIENVDKRDMIFTPQQYYLEIVAFLIKEKKVGINNIDKGGKTLLITASENGHLELVKLLLEQEGIDINAIDRDGYTAIMHASENGHIEIVKLLLEQKMIKINGDKWHPSALTLASKNGNTEIVKLLLQKGININSMDRRGKTALMNAIENNHIETVKILLEQEGIDVNARDDSWWVALMYVILTGNLEIAKILLKHPKIDINAINRDGWTPLLFATTCGCKEIAKLLREKGAKQ